MRDEELEGFIVRRFSIRAHIMAGCECNNVRQENKDKREFCLNCLFLFLKTTSQHCHSLSFLTRSSQVEER